jgi:3-dehydroquinate synthase
MHAIRLNLKKRSYNILIGWDILKQLGSYLTKLNIGRDAYIITNALIRRKYGKALEDTLKRSGFSVKFKVVPDTEKSKSIETAAGAIKDIAFYDKKKRIFIIAFGGGVIGDLGGFVASIYKRGIPYIQIPTTLLAQVDSSIGGKTAVDLSEGKNLVGAFYQPRLVFSDVKFIATLKPRQMRSGLAEVIKYALIKDAKLFCYLEAKYKEVLTFKKAALTHIIGRCSSIKAGVVQQDEREEKGIRTVLNFGHTAGHAIEAAAKYKGYTHGEAIALGMLVAADMSRKLSLINEASVERIEALIQKVGLPVEIRNVKLGDIVNAHYRDKKFIGARNRFVLITAIGRTKIVENIPLEIIIGSLRKRLF